MSDEQLDVLSHPEADVQLVPDSEVRPLPARARPRKKAVLAPTPAVEHEEESRRCFFPCNREDALVLLGSLLISRDFFLNTVRLPMQDDDLALLSSSLRVSEEVLLAGERPERFPLLIEVDPAVAQRSPRSIAFGELKRLIFRTQAEADEFRFRPVDEFDTGDLEAQVDSALFHCEGDARFSLRAPLADDDYDRRYCADRVVAGIHFLVSAARISDRLVPDLVSFFASAPVGESDTIAFSDVLSALRLSTGPGVPGRRQAAITGAFANDTGRGPRILVQSIAESLAASGSRTDEETRQERRWEAVAHDVMRGRVELDGDHVGDQGSQALRGALLGTVADTPEAVVAFLDSEKPAGVRVVLLASFLTGLKRGVLQTPWKQKQEDVPWLSSLLQMTAGGLGAAANPNDELITFDSSSDNTALTMRVAGQKVASWPVVHPSPDDETSQQWLARFAAAGYDVIGQGSSPHSWIVVLSPGQSVEVAHAEADRVCFPVLKYRLEAGQKFKKVKEVAAALEHGSMFWHQGVDQSGAAFLYCDLPELPTGGARTLVSAKLKETLYLTTASVKARNARRKQSVRKVDNMPLVIAEEPRNADAAALSGDASTEPLS